MILSRFSSHSCSVLYVVQGQSVKIVNPFRCIENNRGETHSKNETNTLGTFLQVQKSSLAVLLACNITISYESRVPGVLLFMFLEQRGEATSR